MPRYVRSVSESLEEYGRGVAGGLIFSLPLLYTMEMWWTGFSMHPNRLLGLVSVTFVLLLGYNRFAGLRRDASWAEVAIDSVEEMGLGFIVSAVILVLLGRITAESRLAEIVGKVAIEAMTVAIGISVGTSQLGGGARTRGNDTGKAGAGKASHEGEDRGKVDADGGGDAGEHVTFLGQTVLAVCGAVLFAANVAPTEEIQLIAFESSWIGLIGLSLLSMSIGALILFFSAFRGARRFARSGNVAEVLSGSVITYAIALVTSAAILWFFGRFEHTSGMMMVAQSVVLAFAASLGASAGRLLLQSNE
ncbi:MAG: TIGR02587 family membrane protein [Gemmatimonadaceae bacterium]